MDRGPAPRRGRGNAFYAEGARAALGIRSEVHALSDVPLPLVHTALGIAACAVLTLLRPDAVGVRTAVIVAGGLAGVVAVSLTLYDHLVYGRAYRHALSAMALPVAAVAAFVVVLGGTQELIVRIAAGVVGVLIIGGVPHLGGLRAAGREGTRTRLSRDAAGVAVLAPILLAALSGGLATWSSACLGGGGVLLVTFDALLTEGLRARSAALAAIIIGAVFAGLVIVLPAVGRGTIRAAALLVLWYGIRGAIAAASGGMSGRIRLVMEYGVFIAAAGAALLWGLLHP